jgi:hypothetical protein
MGRTARDGDVLLVGSLPFQNVDDAFKRMGKGLGDHLFAIPDGEVGPRQIWIGYQLALFQANPAIGVYAESDFQMPDKDEQAQSAQAGAGVDPAIQFQVTDPENLVYDTAGYAAPAIESYEAFKREREAGNIAEGVRFQVTFPGVSSQIEFFFEPGSWDVMNKAYLGAVKSDIEKIAAVVPPEDLAIQFDICIELLDFVCGDEKYSTAWPERTFQEKVDHHLAQIELLPTFVPEDALLGVHLCYGTWGGWPMIAMDDLAICVLAANEAVKRSPRAIDYIHMPVVPEAGEDFFAPLADLAIDDTRLILGMIHFTDGEQEFQRRYDAAHKFAQGFGVASVCGFGRVPDDELDAVIEAHVSAARVLEGAAA